MSSASDQSPSQSTIAPELIDALPKFITSEEREQLSASTPASFQDLPPVIRHTEHDVAVAFEPSLPGFSSEDCSRGVLYVIDSQLVFWSATGKGFAVRYPQITLHAISRAQPDQPLIYCQLDESSPEADDDDGEAFEMRELRIMPKAEDALSPIFEALSLCASLHPNPSDHEDEDGESGTFGIPDEDEMTEAGRAARDYLESIIDDTRLPVHNGDDHDQSDGSAQESDKV